MADDKTPITKTPITASADAAGLGMINNPNATASEHAHYDKLPMTLNQHDSSAPAKTVTPLTFRGAMHKGGSIKVDGAYNLRAGEHVLTAKEAENLKGAHSKAKTVLSMTRGLKSLQRDPMPPPQAGAPMESPSAPSEPPQPMKPAVKPTPPMQPAPKPVKSPIQVKPKAAAKGKRK